jgi:signal transduction histidine kinase
MDTLLASNATTWVGEYKFKKHDGTYIDVRDRAFVIRGAVNKPVRIIGSVLDITQQKELQRAKDRFISLVSHQLRTPLTSMRLLAEMLASDNTEQLSDSQQDFVQKIESSTVRMIHLVNEILNVSSIESGRLNIHPSDTDVSILIQAQIDIISPMTIAKHITIEYEPDQRVRRVHVDPMLFSQIVHNLITNAIRYTAKDNAIIRVAFEKKKDSYLLTVNDQGIGIPKEAQSHIFSSFYRANNAIKSHGDGSGLGLYLAKLILDVTGGTIWFSSEEGQGSTFYVSLPLSGMQNSQGTESDVLAPRSRQ